MIAEFHFLRPAWLLGLLPLAGLIWMLLKYRFDFANWREVVDARLLPFVLTAEGAAHKRSSSWVFAIAAVLAILALAGPTWEKQPQPVYQLQSALVIVLDLSRSMDATDLRPSRLVRARHKISDILQRRREGLSALVVYAADAFTVTPLTDDVDTILAMLPSLESNIMPAQGTRVDRALKLAFELLANGGIANGDILLISDGLSQRELDYVETLWDAQSGHRLSVLAVGTEEGGPIPLPSGDFLKDRTGSIVIAGLNESGLRQVADLGGGIYTRLGNNDRDIEALATVLQSRLIESDTQVSDRSAELWYELGPWLILFALPLAALGFRRGLFWLWPIALLILPPEADAFEWRDLWRNSDQHAAELFDQGDYTTAAELFDDPAWSASAHYRSGDYETALDMWQQQESDTANYNRGNVLAKMGRYSDAIEAYEQALSINPEHEDALHNKTQIEEWLKNQQASDSGEDEQQQDDEFSNQQQPDRQQQDRQQTGEDPKREEGELQNAQKESGDQAGEQSQADQANEPDESEAALEDKVAELEEQMSEQAAEQWLRKIPDDPGGLLRRKFLYQYRQRGGVDTEALSW